MTNENCEMTTTTREEFAYGTNEFGKVPCPAKAAGFSDSEIHGHMAAEYDRKVKKNKSGRPAGTIPESVAKEKWLQAIEDLKHRYSVVEKSPHVFGREVAEELGWLDDE